MECLYGRHADFDEGDAECPKCYIELQTESYVREREAKHLREALEETHALLCLAGSEATINGVAYIGSLRWSKNKVALGEK